MSKKKPIYVNIPVGHVCVKMDYLQQKQICIETREKENFYLRHELYKVQDENENLKKQLAEAEEKVAALENELSEKQDRILYWYQKYTDLADKLNAVKPDAETKTT